MNKPQSHLVKNFGPAADRQRQAREKSRMDHAQKELQYLANKRPPFIGSEEDTANFEILTKMLQAALAEEQAKTQTSEGITVSPKAPEISPAEASARAHAKNIERFDRILNGRGGRQKRPAKHDGI